MQKASTVPLACKCLTGPTYWVRFEICLKRDAPTDGKNYLKYRPIAAELVDAGAWPQESVPPKRMKDARAADECQYRK
jgi:hypothetical protein